MASTSSDSSPAVSGLSSDLEKTFTSKALNDEFKKFMDESLSTESEEEKQFYFDTTPLFLDEQGKSRSKSGGSEAKINRDSTLEKSWLKKKSPSSDVAESKDLSKDEIIPKAPPSLVVESKDVSKNEISPEVEAKEVGAKTFNSQYNKEILDDDSSNKTSSSDDDSDNEIKEELEGDIETKWPLQRVLSNITEVTEGISDTKITESSSDRYSEKFESTDENSNESVKDRNEPKKQDSNEHDKENINDSEKNCSIESERDYSNESERDYSNESEKEYSYELDKEYIIESETEDSNESKKEDSNESKKEDSNESKKEDCNESEKEDSNESEKEDSNESEKEDSNESEKVDSNESEKEDSNESEKEDSNESEKEESNESEKDDSNNSDPNNQSDAAYDLRKVSNVKSDFEIYTGQLLPVEEASASRLDQIEKTGNVKVYATKDITENTFSKNLEHGTIIFDLERKLKPFENIDKKCESDFSFETSNIVGSGVNDSSVEAEIHFDQMVHLKQNSTFTKAFAKSSNSELAISKSDNPKKIEIEVPTCMYKSMTNKDEFKSSAEVVYESSHSVTAKGHNHIASKTDSISSNLNKMSRSSIVSIRKPGRPNSVKSEECLISTRAKQQMNVNLLKAKIDKFPVSSAIRDSVKVLQPNKESMKSNLMLTRFQKLKKDHEHLESLMKAYEKENEKLSDEVKKLKVSSRTSELRLRTEKQRADFQLTVLKGKVEQLELRKDISSPNELSHAENKSQSIENKKLTAALNEAKNEIKRLKENFAELSQENNSLKITAASHNILQLKISHLEKELFEERKQVSVLQNLNSDMTNKLTIIQKVPNPILTSFETEMKEIIAEMKNRDQQFVEVVKSLQDHHSALKQAYTKVVCELEEKCNTMNCSDISSVVEIITKNVACGQDIVKAKAVAVQTMLPFDDSFKCSKDSEIQNMIKIFKSKFELMDVTSNYNCSYNDFQNSLENLESYRIKTEILEEKLLRSNLRLEEVVKGNRYLQSKIERLNEKIINLLSGKPNEINLFVSLEKKIEELEKMYDERQAQLTGLCHQLEEHTTSHLEEDLYHAQDLLVIKNQQLQQYRSELDSFIILLNEFVKKT